MKSIQVVEVMAELDIDLSGKQPQSVSTAELNECDVVATMGCSTLESDADVEVRDWAVEDPPRARYGDCPRDPR